MEDVAAAGSGSASGDSVATSGTASSVGGAGVDAVAIGVAVGTAATDASVGIRGSTKSEELMRLSMMRAKYSNFSMLCS